MGGTWGRGGAWGKWVEPRGKMERAWRRWVGPVGKAGPGGDGWSLEERQGPHERGGAWWRGGALGEGWSLEERWGLGEMGGTCGKGRTWGRWVEPEGEARAS